MLIRTKITLLGVEKNLGLAKKHGMRIWRVVESHVDLLEERSMPHKGGGLVTKLGHPSHQSCHLLT